MRKLVTLLALQLAFSAASLAQVQEGDLLLTSFSTTAALAHYRTDGTVVQTYAPPAGQRWNAVAVPPDGSVVVTRSEPANGMVIFDPVTLAVELDMDFAAAHITGVAGYVEVRRDGTIVVNDASAFNEPAA